MGVSFRCLVLVLLALLAAPLRVWAQPAGTAPAPTPVAQATEVPGEPAPAKEGTPEERARAADHERRGIECYENLNYGCARAELQKALALHETVSIHQYLAYTLVALGDEEEAVNHFVRIKQLDAGYALSRKKVSPKIYRAYRIALHRHEAEERARERNLLTRSRTQIDDFFTGLVEPIQESEISWFEVDFEDRIQMELFVGYSLMVGDEVTPVANGFEAGPTFGGQFLYAINENLTVGPSVRYSNHFETARPGPRSLDILLTGGEVRLQEVTRTFLFFMSLGGGAALMGFDGVGDELGWYVAPTAGAHAIVTKNLSLGVRAGLTLLQRTANVTGKDTALEVPVMFELSYLY